MGKRAGGEDVQNEAMVVGGQAAEEAMVKKRLSMRKLRVTQFSNSVKPSPTPTPT